MYYVKQRKRQNRKEITGKRQFFYSCYNDPPCHRRASARELLGRQVLSTAMSSTPTDPQRTMIKRQGRKSHSLGENIDPTTESNRSQGLLAELTKLEEHMPEAAWAEGTQTSLATVSPTT